MSITLHLPRELENELSAEATQRGLSLPEYALHVLSTALTRSNKPRTGAELVEYWQSEGLIGMRSDIADSPTRARQIRAQAEKRMGG